MSNNTLETLPQSVYDLARRCLHIAFNWNDHNFPPAHHMARAEAERYGIKSFDDANAWLENPVEWPVKNPLPLPRTVIGYDLSREDDRTIEAIRRPDGTVQFRETSRTVTDEAVVEAMDSLLSRVRAGSEAAPWVVEELQRIRTALSGMK